MRIRKENNEYVCITGTRKYDNIIIVVYNRDRDTIRCKYIRKLNDREVKQYIVAYRPKMFLIGLAVLVVAVLAENRMLDNVSEVDLLAIERELYSYLLELVRRYSR